MGRTACTERTACTRVHFTYFYFACTCLCSELLKCTNTSGQTDILKPRNENAIEVRSDTLQNKTDFITSHGVGKRSSVAPY